MIEIAQTAAVIVLTIASPTNSHDSVSMKCEGLNYSTSKANVFVIPNSWAATRKNGKLDVEWMCAGSKATRRVEFVSTNGIPSKEQRDVVEFNIGDRVIASDVSVRTDK